MRRERPGMDIAVGVMVGSRMAHRRAEQQAEQQQYQQQSQGMVFLCVLGTFDNTNANFCFSPISSS